MYWAPGEDQRRLLTCDMQPAPNDNRLPPAPQPGVAWPGAVIANSAAQLPGMPGMPLQMPMLPQSFPTMPGQHAPLLTQHQAPLGMPLPGRPAMLAAPGPAMLNPHGAWGYGFQGQPALQPMGLHAMQVPQPQAFAAALPPAPAPAPSVMADEPEEEEVGLAGSRARRETAGRLLPTQHRETRPKPRSPGGV